MKLLLIICIALLLPVAGPAWMNVTVGGGGVPVAVGGCMSGTYVVGWDGDYPSDTDKACFGSTPTDGTITDATIGTDYGESSNGVLIDAVDERITWPLTDGDFNETGAYTLWMRIRIGSDGTDTNTVIWEISEDTDNTNYIMVTVTDDERIRVTYEGNNTADNVQSAAASLTRDGSTWYTVGLSWYPGEAGNDMGVTVDGGSNWTEEDDDLVSIVIEINYLSLGNYYQYQAAGPDPVHVDKFALVSGYKTACPW